MNCNEFWTAFGALGQWACAAATLGAVIIALKPYKRKIKVELSSIILDFNGERSVISYTLNIQNKGFIKERIVATGIESTDGHFILSENETQIEEEGFAKIAVQREALWNNLSLVDDKRFRFWIQDSAGYSYYSKYYPTAKYKYSINIKKEREPQ